MSGVCESRLLWRGRFMRMMGSSAEGGGQRAMANSGDGVLQRACLLRGGVMGFERAEHSTVGFAAAAARSARVAGGSRDASE